MNSVIKNKSSDIIKLCEQLEKITGKKVDLVSEERIANKYFLNRVSQKKIKIYEC